MCFCSACSVFFKAPAGCRGNVHFLEEGRGRGRASLAGFRDHPGCWSIDSEREFGDFEDLFAVPALPAPCGGLVAPAWTGTASPTTCWYTSALAGHPALWMSSRFPSMSCSCSSFGHESGRLLCLPRGSSWRRSPLASSGSPWDVSVEIDSVAGRRTSPTSLRTLLCVGFICIWRKVRWSSPTSLRTNLS